MPYNTSAIPPRKEPTGQAQLPLSRVKKIISQDPDIQVCSNNAAFIITLAAEMFIQHLADEAYTQAKLERKPRRNIQYKDIANAISHHDNLEFLEDVAPKTIPFKKAKASASAAQAHLRGEAAVAPTPSSQSRILTNGHGDPNDSVLLHHHHHHHHHHHNNHSNNSHAEQQQQQHHPGNGAYFALASRDPHKHKSKSHKAKPKPKHQRQDELAAGEQEDEGEGDSNAQLELEMRQALRPAKDIDMTG